MKLATLIAFSLVTQADLSLGQRLVSFSLPDGTAQIQADVYGHGERAVILAHGGRFNKESWKKQAEILANSGFLTLAIRFRGDKFNADGSPSAEGSTDDNAADVLAAVSYLRGIGAKSISAVGASLGGDAVGEANARSAPGTFARSVFLGSDGGDEPEKLTGRKLFIVAREDRNGSRLPGIEAHYIRAREPKKLVILDGAAHAQVLFETDEGPRLLKEILRFLAEP